MEGTVTGSSVLAELWALVKLSAPLSATKFIVSVGRVVNVGFVGRITDGRSLAAVSLASTFASVTGFSTIVAFGGGLATMGSQAYGAGEFAAVGYHFQLMLILVMALCCVIIAPMYIASRPLLELLGQGSSVARDASKFLILALPSVIAFGVRNSIQGFAQVQYVVAPFTVNAIVTTAVTLPVSFWLISNPRLGYLGAAIAASVASSLQLLLDGGYVFCSGLYRKCIRGLITRTHISKALVPMLKLSFASLLTLGEWWASEITVLIAGRLPSTAKYDAESSLAAMGIFGNVNGLMFMIPLGIVIAVSTRVGNELGAGNPGNAKRSTACAMALALSVTTANGAVLFGFRDHFAQAFVPRSNEHLYALVSSFVVPLIGYHMLDGVSEAINGAFEGMGRQNFAFPVIILCHFIIGIPVSVVLGFHYQLGVKGLVIGRLVGKTLQTVVFVAMIARTDWDVECDRANRSVGETRGADESTPLLPNE